MARTLGILFTMTTYGTWLRGDQRGWVDRGIVYPAMPALEKHNRQLLKHEPFYFDTHQLHEIGSMIGHALRNRLNERILALTVQPWHVHIVTMASVNHCSVIVKCAKDAVRWGLRPNQAIWTTKYDKRFCFDAASLRARIEYVERHNRVMNGPAKPWPFIEDVNDYLDSFT